MSLKRNGRGDLVLDTGVGLKTAVDGKVEVNLGQSLEIDEEGEIEVPATAQVDADGTELTFGEIADGEMVVRSGTTLVGQAVPEGEGGGGFVVSGVQTFAIWRAGPGGDLKYSPMEGEKDTAHYLPGLRGMRIAAACTLQDIKLSYQTYRTTTAHPTVGIDLYIGETVVASWLIEDEGGGTKTGINVNPTEGADLEIPLVAGDVFSIQAYYYDNPANEQVSVQASVSYGFGPPAA
jgi:hypothetical protein